MKTISELTSQEIATTGKASREEQDVSLPPTEPSGTKKGPYAYEDEVFNYLQENRRGLGIQAVRKFKNRFVDGQIILSDGRRLAVEIKFRMNWLKACQAEWEFQQFLKRTSEAKNNPVVGAVVFFSEFSGDWNRKAKKAKNLWGWEGWYIFHSDNIDGKRMDLLLLRDGTLQGYPGDT